MDWIHGLTEGQDGEVNKFGAGRGCQPVHMWLG